MKHCQWAEGSDLLKSYHDTIWGVPCYDDHELFKKLILDGMQAGLSWHIILKKQKAIEKAFDDFDIEKIINYNDEKIEALMQDAGIIRNKLKIKSVITNAKAYVELKQTHGSLSNYLWSFVNHQPIDHHIESMRDIPTKNELSDQISKDLIKKGFKFVGSTIIYAYLQAIGIINDHEVTCERYQQLKKVSLK